MDINSIIKKNGLLPITVKTSKSMLKSSIARRTHRIQSKINGAYIDKYQTYEDGDASINRKRIEALQRNENNYY